MGPPIRANSAPKKGNRMLAKLTSLHTELSSALSELDCLTRQHVPDRAILAEVRWNLIRASIDRTRYLTEQVYPFLLRTLPAAAAEPVRALREEGSRLRGISSKHVGRWPIEKTIAQWPRYCSESLEMRASMRRRIEEEKSVLCSLLATLDRGLAEAQAAA